MSGIVIKAHFQGVIFDGVENYRLFFLQIDYLEQGLECVSSRVVIRNIYNKFANLKINI